MGLPSRVEQRKLRTVEGLDEFLNRSNPFEAIPQRQSFRIDTTNLPPADVAKQIQLHFRIASAQG